MRDRRGAIDDTNVPKALLRQLVFDAALENGKVYCALCDEPIDPNNWHLGHNRPRIRGGKTILSNLIPLHPRCNVSMSTNTLAEARRYLK